MLCKSGKEKSDTWLQKNPTHFMTDVATSLWTGFKEQKVVFLS